MTKGNCEKTNARFLSDKIIKHELDVIVCDASFISLKKSYSALKYLKTNSWLAALIKPQFEVGKVGWEGGIIKNSKLHEIVINDKKLGYK